MLFFIMITLLKGFIFKMAENISGLSIMTTSKSNKINYFTAAFDSIFKQLLFPFRWLMDEKLTYF